MHHAVVTSQAIVLKNFSIPRTDLNGFMKILERKPFGVPIPVVRFGDVFGDEAVGQVAVHTFRCRMMAGFLP